MNKIDKKNIILSVVFTGSMVLFGIALAKILTAVI